MVIPLVEDMYTLYFKPSSLAYIYTSPSAVMQYPFSLLAVSVSKVTVIISSLSMLEPFQPLPESTLYHSDVFVPAFMLIRHATLKPIRVAANERQIIIAIIAATGLFFFFLGVGIG